MIVLTSPPIKPEPQTYGIKENDFEIVRLAKDKHKKDEERRTNRISFVSIILAESTLFIIGVIFVSFYGNGNLKLDNFFSVIEVGFIGCVVGTITMFPVIMIWSLFNNLLSYAFKTSSIPNEIKVIENSIKNYKDAIDIYNKKNRDFAKQYPGFIECGCNANVYYEKIYNDIMKDMKSIGNRLVLSNKTSYWKNMTWEEFEHAVANWFIGNGYSAHVTQKSGDGGYDIIVQRNNKKAYVQCKHYKGQIGVTVVRELYGVMCKDNISKGYIAYLEGGLTKEAQVFVKEVNIIPLSLKDFLSKNQTPVLEEQNKPSYLQIGKYWIKKELFASESEAIVTAKSGKFDSFFSKVNFTIHKSPVTRDLFSKEDKNLVEYEDAYYGILKVQNYPFYIIVYSTLSYLEYIGSIPVVKEKTKEVSRTSYLVSNIANCKPSKKIRRHNYYRSY